MIAAAAAAWLRAGKTSSLSLMAAPNALVEESASALA
jgi:hypothetical protein